MDGKSVKKPRLVYAGNRKIGLKGLEILVESGLVPVALILPAGESAECVREMRKLVPQVPVFWGKEFYLPVNIRRLRELDIDYILSIHFPYIIPTEVLQIPRIGTLNLHPAFLPYNRGWHTPTWAILENSPYGATLHWVDDGIDSGDIAMQDEIKIYPYDTAHSLYQRVLKLEEKILRDAIPLLLEYRLPRVPQEGEGTMHLKSDIHSIQKLKLEEYMEVGKVIRLLRALTTNKLQEAAYFEVDGSRYRITVKIEKE